MERGLFITFEGSEGCGKSTQIERLAGHLEEAKVPFILTREPGGTPIGEKIRHLVQFSKAGDAMTPEAELLLFTASRAQLAREVIEPALASGKTVVADRYLDSTTVYQGVARKIDAGTVKTINDFAAGGVLPDITFVLDLDSDKARKRVLARPESAGPVDRMEQQPAEFYEAVREGYLRLALAERARVRLIDASKSVGEIEDEIWGHVREKLNARV